MKKVVKLAVLSIAFPGLFVAWFILTIFFIVPGSLLFIFNKITGRLTYNSKSKWQRNDINNPEIIFNRIRDVSKNYGCDTRNVQYRWDLFLEELENMEKAINVLDFGAGSLRDSFYFHKNGYMVDSIDINLKQMKEASIFYNWHKKPPRLFTEIPDKKYDLILAFDVLEHLPDLHGVLSNLRNHLKTNGCIFVSVPNRLSFFERLFRFQHKERMRKNIYDKSGASHVNFMTPAEWINLFNSTGFIVKNHDMTLGFLVNDIFHGIFGISSRLFINTTWQKFNEKIFYPRWLMVFVNELDYLTKPLLWTLWGWNLMILSKQKNDFNALIASSR